MLFRLETALSAAQPAGSEDLEVRVSHATDGDGQLRMLYAAAPPLPCLTVCEETGIPCSEAYVNMLKESENMSITGQLDVMSRGNLVSIVV